MTKKPANDMFSTITCHLGDRKYFVHKVCGASVGSPWKLMKYFSLSLSFSASLFLPSSPSLPPSPSYLLPSLLPLVYTYPTFINTTQVRTTPHSSNRGQSNKQSLQVTTTNGHNNRLCVNRLPPLILIAHINTAISH